MKRTKREEDEEERPVMEVTIKTDLEEVKVKGKDWFVAIANFEGTGKLVHPIFWNPEVNPMSEEFVKKLHGGE